MALDTCGTGHFWHWTLVALDTFGTEHLWHWASANLTCCSSTMAWGLKHRTVNEEDLSLNPILLCKPLGKFLHSTLLQFTQMYE